ncbi:MAG TPA: hypothetical protein VN999_12015 [Thermoanaerobaculia bacterium]|nr:hypothetical protein [Thermoanaerobaculia bacterium]
MRFVASLCCTILFLLAPAAFAATEVETTALANIVPITPTIGDQYNTTGITIGNWLYIYNEGNGRTPFDGPPYTWEDASCPDGHDKIIAWRAPITNGVPGALQRIGRISPCVYSPVPAPNDPNPHVAMGPGQVFSATVGGVQKYFLLADASDANTFHNIWRGESTNGSDWTWYISADINNSQFNGRRETIQEQTDTLQHFVTTIVQPYSFIHSDSGYLLDPILVSLDGSNNGQWWGFLNTYSCNANSCGSNFGEMVVNFDSQGNPSVRILTSAAPYTFTTLTSTGGPGGSFLFNVNPVLFHSDVNVKALLYDPTYGGYQLWGSNEGYSAPGLYGVAVNCNTSASLVCQNPSGCATGDGSGCPYNTRCNVFTLNTGTPGTSTDPTIYANKLEKSTFIWFPVTRFSFGADNFIAGSSGGRYFPSGYGGSREYPFRWNSPTGRRYVLSTTSDTAVCSRFLTFGVGGAAYIAQTEVALQ